VKLIAGIASTTHADAHEEVVPLNALESMARQVRERFIPQLIDHDPNQQVGVNLCARVDELEDGEYALVVVSGIFEKPEERLLYRTFAANTVWKNYLPYLDSVLEDADLPEETLAPDSL